MENAECRMQNAELIDNNYSVIPKSRAFFGDYTNA